MQAAGSFDAEKLDVRSYRHEQLMAVEVLPGEMFVTGQQTALFSTQTFFSNIVHPPYDVALDDQRFIMVHEPREGAGGRLVVVENFCEELRSRFEN